jgi:hypothetical protein
MALLDDGTAHYERALKIIREFEAHPASGLLALPALNEFALSSRLPTDPALID